ncbi:hypothetical protein [Vulcaniibacterium tengchongense]|uniref:Uncharacterized protein n=1 Tax=Vulcaniibacterium tengchongense TaxID=1273429 RepID=A0A3N4VNK3_9GAMM|nr:hypothetical protein [Vulcaniibacterium tengchongense]RPE74664.1 hypothetical protein EDC50_3193 [Vulcaniibacterium tengchongense]
MDWHREYVAESIKRFELDSFRRDPSFEWLQLVAAQNPRIADHARTVALEAGDTHGAAVAETVRNSVQGRRPRVSPKQGFVVARILAEKYGTARAVAAALYGLTDEEINDASV